MKTSAVRIFEGEKEKWSKLVVAIKLQAMFWSTTSPLRWMARTVSVSV